MSTVVCQKLSESNIEDTNLYFLILKMVFTNVHKAFMVEAYFRNGQKIDGQWKYSIQACLEEFRDEFPNLAFDYNTFQCTLIRIVPVFRQTGSVGRQEGGGRPKVRTEEVIGNVREIMTDAPKTSVRTLAQQTGLSVGSCHKVLKEDLQLFPYRITCLQEILDIDYPRRVVFCEWFTNNFNDDVLDKTFFSDEAWFHVSGYVNSQNMRMWSDTKPNNFYVEAPLHPQKVGVWCAISRRRIIGPIFFNGTLTAERYRQEILLPFFNQLRDDELALGYFQQDGARAHTAGETMNMLQEVFGNRLISLNSDHEFPPRSCDLTPCDYYLWPFLKNSIYQVPVQDYIDLQDRIINKISEIRNSPILQNVFSSIRRRCVKCLEEGGGHFQHLL